jgi:hypothetical protein
MGHRRPEGEEFGFALDSPLEQSGFELWVPPACDAPAATRFVADSALEEGGFELSVPGHGELQVFACRRPKLPRRQFKPW